MKTAISIPDELFQRAERATKRMRLSRSELYRQALSVFLDSREDRAITEALNRVYGDAAEESRLDPLLDQLQSASISQEPW